MKPAIRYIFFLGMIFFHPCRVLSLESRQDSNFNNCFQEIKPECSIFSEGSPNAAFFFEDDLINDDDDEITSVKKKIFFVCTTCFDNNQNTPTVSCNNLRDKFYCYHDFSPSYLSDFISLRVLRL